MKGLSRRHRVSWGVSRSILGVSWRLLGVLEGILEASLAGLGRFWIPLGGILGGLGGSWRHLGGVLVGFSHQNGAKLVSKSVKSWILC